MLCCSRGGILYFAVLSTCQAQILSAPPKMLLHLVVFHEQIAEWQRSAFNFLFILDIHELMPVFQPSIKMTSIPGMSFFITFFNTLLDLVVNKLFWFDIQTAENLYTDDDSRGTQVSCSRPRGQRDPRSCAPQEKEERKTWSSNSSGGEWCYVCSIFRVHSLGKAWSLEHDIQTWKYCYRIGK